MSSSSLRPALDSVLLASSREILTSNPTMLACNRASLASISAALGFSRVVLTSRQVTRAVSLNEASGRCERALVAPCHLVELLALHSHCAQEALVGIGRGKERWGGKVRVDLQDVDGIRHGDGP